MKPLYHRGDIPVKGFALPFIEDFPSFSPQDLFILRFGYSFRQPRRNAAGSRKTIFVVCTIKTYRATNECWKTGLPRPVSCVWNVPLTPRRTAGPGPARVLVHWGETWSHPRGTLGRCHKGSEINIHCPNINRFSPRGIRKNARAMGPERLKPDYSAAFAFSQREVKAAVSWMAISESILRFREMPAFLRPFMKVE